MTRITIRAAAAGDEDILASLNAFVHDLHVAQRPKHFKRALSGEVRNWFRDLFSRKDVRIFIAAEAGVPVGFACVMIHGKPENPLAFAYRWHEIDSIVVHPGHRKKGVARALVRAAVKNAVAGGIRNVELTAWSFNTDAQRAFEKLGFEPKVTRYKLKTDG